MPKLKEFHFKILCLTGHIIAIKIVIGDVVEVFLAICFTAYRLIGTPFILSANSFWYKKRVGTKHMRDTY